MRERQVEDSIQTDKTEFGLNQRIVIEDTLEAFTENNRCADRETEHEKHRKFAHSVHT
jgi:hypothetical protein